MITFAGTALETAYHCKIFRSETDMAPARVYDSLEVPGRSGNLILDGKRFPNVEMTYTALFYADTIESDVTGMKNFLLSQVGYKRLEDAEHPGEFYMAVVAGELEPDFNMHRDMAKMSLTFERKPQRFLISGESRTLLINPGSITNPTMFPSQPLLYVTSRGNLTINDQTIVINGAPVYIDSEMMDCYKGTTSMNDKVSFSDYKFPELRPGVNNFSWTTGIATVSIYPRWWKL